MINQIEILMFLEEALPEISGELKQNKGNDAYDNIQALTNFTCKSANAHNYKLLKRCFSVADKLYEKGNNVVKNAIENIFVYSFTRLFQNDQANKRILHGLVPGTLYSVYMTQLYCRGC